MKIKVRLLLALVITAMAFTGFSPNMAKADSSGLGVGLRVLPGGEGDVNSGLTGNTKLWFVVKQGDSFSRDLLLTGSATLNQKISLSLVQLARVDGQPSITDLPSDVAQWTDFSANSFVLKKNQSKQIRFTISPPQYVPSSAFEAYLIVTASGLQETAVDGDTTQAIIKNSARVAQPVFVGVGSYEEFKIDFEIKNVEDINNSEGKFLRVFISNRGKTPISPNGQVQLKNMDFEQAAIGPIEFYSSTISPETDAYIDVPLPQDVNPGKWRILVRATQGNITVTKDFERDFAFRLGFNWFSLLIKVLALLIGSILALWAYRTLRPNRLNKENNEIVQNLHKMEETKALIAQLEAKAAALEDQVARRAIPSRQTNSASKKAPAKSKTKKAVAKKQTKRKK